MRFFSFTLLSVLVISQFAAADTIVYPNIEIEQPSNFGADTFQLKIVDTPDPDVFVVGGTGWFSVTASDTDGHAKITYRDTDVGIGREWYAADYNQRFNYSTVAAGDFFRIGTNGGEIVNGSIDVPFGDDLWMGVNTGFWPNEGDTQFDYFGWVKLNVDENLNVTPLDSAFSLDGDGIVIGRNIVPEPGTASVMLAGVIILFARRRRRVGR